MRYYHPLSGVEFIKSIRTVCWFLIRFQMQRLRGYFNTEAGTAKKKTEDRYDSIVGIYALFFGFALQGFGALCWFIDSVIDIVNT